MHTQVAINKMIKNKTAPPTISERNPAAERAAFPGALEHLQFGPVQLIQEVHWQLPEHIMQLPPQLQLKSQKSQDLLGQIHLFP